MLRTRAFLLAAALVSATGGLLYAQGTQSGVINGTVTDRIALSLEYAYEERDFDFTQVSNNSLFEDYVETRRLRPSRQTGMSGSVATATVQALKKAGANTTRTGAPIPAPDFVGALSRVPRPSVGRVGARPGAQPAVTCNGESAWLPATGGPATEVPLRPPP